LVKSGGDRLIKCREGIDEEPLMEVFGEPPGRGVKEDVLEICLIEGLVYFGGFSEVFGYFWRVFEVF
jgi:hypothetical protein